MSQNNLLINLLSARKGHEKKIATYRLFLNWDKINVDNQFKKILRKENFDENEYATQIRDEKKARFHEHYLFKKTSLEYQLKTEAGTYSYGLEVKKQLLIGHRKKLQEKIKTRGEISLPDTNQNIDSIKKKEKDELLENKKQVENLESENKQLEKAIEYLASTQQMLRQEEKLPKLPNNLTFYLSNMDKSKYDELNQKSPYQQVRFLSKQVGENQANIKKLLDKKVHIKNKSVNAIQDTGKENNYLLSLINKNSTDLKQIKNYEEEIKNIKEEVKTINIDEEYKNLLIKNKSQFDAINHDYSEQLEKIKKEKVIFNHSQAYQEIKNLDKKYAEWKEQILERKRYVEKRNISSIVHFTRVSNLDSILDHGNIYSRKKMDDTEIKYTVSDHHRFDDKLDYISCSITFPNYGMFYKKRVFGLPIEQWVVLELDPVIIWKQLCLFYPTNAASRDMKNLEAPLYNQDLMHLFYDERRNLSPLEQNETTDPQAEILIFNRISKKHIKAISCQNQKMTQRLAYKHRNYSNLFKTKEDMFKPRHDHKHWGINNG